MVQALRCVECGTTYAPDEVAYTCPKHEGNVGILDVEYDYDHAARAGFGSEMLASRSTEDSLRRYAELLPVPDEQAEEYPPDWVGRTPVFETPEVAKRLQISRLQVKNDGLLPTGSLKDRASSVGAAKARLEGHSAIACASTGNAATSLAGICAHVGLTPYIFVPRGAPEAKVAQLAVFGAKVMLVDGSYEQAYDLCQQGVEEFGWYNRNCAVNPYLVEGKKTCGLEVAEQIGEDPPDWISMSVGDGCSVAALYKGLVEMRRFGFIEKIPKLLAVQAEGAAPLARAFHENRPFEPLAEANSLADSIAVAHPRNSRKALTAVRDSGGTFVEVADEEILRAIFLLASLGGVFAEPAGAAAIAGIAKARREGVVWSTERVLHVCTGTGLKDVAAGRRSAPEPPVIAPSIQDVRRIVAGDQV